jgi:uncharacterized protein (TIGR02453 family)
MIQKATLDFLKKLKANNNRDWFEKNREKFEAAKNDIEKNTEELLKSIRSFDKRIPSDLEAKKCMFRIYRDVRFSKDKRPYKNNLGAHVQPGGKKAHGCGYYIHVEAGRAFLAGGIWQPEAPELAKIRQEIDYNWPEFKKIISSATFKKHFGELDTEDKLAREPKGYAKDHPAIEYLKLKSFTVSAELTDKEIMSKDYQKKAKEIFKAMLPLNLFLQRALD